MKQLIINKAPNSTEQGAYFLSLSSESIIASCIIITTNKAACMPSTSSKNELGYNHENGTLIILY